MSLVAGDDRRQPGTTPDPKGFEVSGKIMLTAIIILFFVVVFMASLHFYFRWYFLRQRRRQALLRRRRRAANGSRAAAAAHIVFYVDGNNPHALVDPANTGLDAAVLRSLPKFVFSSKTSPEGLECAVCLSEFEENESGRVLPKCSHSFHTECIDMWFHSHSTCPICRAGVEPVLEPENPVETLPDSVSDLCSGCQHAGAGEGSSMPAPLDSRRKGLDFASVRIDVPMRGAELDTELPLSSPASYGFRSPGTRLLTLKRILSMGRKTPTASPSSTAGPSCSAGAAELDLESGRNHTESTWAPTPRRHGEMKKPGSIREG